MGQTSKEQLRQYGQQENQYVVSNIFNPDAFGYDKPEMIEEVATRACEQASHAFGKDDPIHIEALLNLSLFYLYKIKNAEKALPSLDKARAILNEKPAGKDLLVAELIAIKVLVDLLDDHPDESVFIVEDLAHYQDAPFGISSALSNESRAVAIFRKMAAAATGTRNFVAQYVIGEVGTPLAEQLAYAGFTESALDVFEICIPLMEAVWEDGSLHVLTAEDEREWLTNPVVAEIELRHYLEQLVIFLRAVAPGPNVIKNVPIDVEKACELFGEATRNNLKIIEAKIENIPTLSSETLDLFAGVLQQLGNITPTRASSKIIFSLRFYTHTFLGCLYLTFPTSERANCVEVAIQHLKRSHEIFYDSEAIVKTDKQVKRVYECIKVLLAYCYTLRVKGEPEDNLDLVLVHTDSVELKKEKDPYLWALNKSLRAKAFALRKQTKIFTGAKANEWSALMDYEIAMHFVDDAMKVFNEEQFPYEYWDSVLSWIMIMGNGHAQKEQPDKFSYTFYYQLKVAEDFFNPQRDAFKWMLLQIEKAKLADFFSTFRDARLPSRPLDILRRAQAFLNKKLFPKEWGLLELEKARMVSKNNSALAIHYYQSCLSVLDQHLIRERFVALYELGHLLFDGKEFDKAMAFLQECYEIGVGFFERCGKLTTRRLAISSMEGITRILSFCLYQCNRFDEAVVFLDKGKSQLLYDILELRSTDFSGLRNDEKEDAEKLVAEIKTLESSGYGGMMYMEEMERLNEARIEIKEFLAKQGMIASPSVEDVTRLLPADAALVMPLFTKHGSVVFVLTRGCSHLTEQNVVSIPGVNEELIQKSLTGEKDGWFVLYKERNDLVAGAQRFEDGITETSEMLGSVLFQPVVNLLNNLSIKEIVLVPGQGLQFLPAMSIMINEKMLLDQFRLRVVPSARILLQLSKDQVSENLQKAVVAGVSDYAKLPSLPSASNEVNAISKILSASPLLNEDVRKEVVSEKIKGAAYVHLACHGSQWAEDPSFRQRFAPADVLYFKDDGVSFKDILLQWDLGECRLITTSACDTGLVEFGRPWDEFEGLSHIFMQAGARTILGSLWSVDDESTALLMVKFYELVIGSKEAPSTALQKAQVWLRESTHEYLSSMYPDLYKSFSNDKTVAKDFKPFEHPYYWAPFFITGI